MAIGNGGTAATTANETQQLSLPDGRILGFATYGDPAGAPMFVFHGTPGSRLMVRPIEVAAARQGIRVIAPDRPGFGGSTHLAGRRIADWPDDVAALADALGIAKFSVIGISGGGPYAAACAWKLPERLTAVGIVSGVAPVDQVERVDGWDRRHDFAYSLAGHAPWLARGVTTAGAFAWSQFPELMYERMRAAAPEIDQAPLARPEVRTAMIAGIIEAFRAGGRGLAEELMLFARPWTFSPAAIRSRVHLWHGEQDALVPTQMGRALAALIPDCHAQFITGGHYLVFDQMDAILQALRP